MPQTSGQRATLADFAAKRDAKNRMAKSHRGDPTRGPGARPVPAIEQQGAEKMETILIRTAIASLVLVAAATPAFAGNLDKAKSLCAGAIAAEAGKSTEGARIKLVKGRDGAAKRVTVTVSFADGAAATGDCVVRKGEVSEIALVP